MKFTCETNQKIKFLISCLHNSRVKIKRVYQPVIIKFFSLCTCDSCHSSCHLPSGRVCHHLWPFELATFWLSADNQIEIEVVREGDFWLPHFIWPGRNFQLTQVASSVAAPWGKAFVFHAWWPSMALTLLLAWPAGQQRPGHVNCRTVQDLCGSRY